MGDILGVGWIDGDEPAETGGWHPAKRITISKLFKTIMGLDERQLILLNPLIYYISKRKLLNPLCQDQEQTPMLPSLRSYTTAFL
jgi:hypothetical protein